MDQLQTLQAFVKIFSQIRLYVILLGIIGNMFSFVIFTRKVFRKNSIGLYSQALAIWNNVLIFQLALDIAVEYFNTNLMIGSNAFCKIYNYSLTINSPITAWILVVFSLDKMLNVSQRHQTSQLYSKLIKLMDSKRFQYGIISAITIIHAIAYSPVLIWLNLEQIPDNNSQNGTKTICELGGALRTAVSFGLAFDSIFVPFAILIYSSIVTINSLIKSRKNLEQLTGTTIVTVASSDNNRQRKKRDRKFAINSVVLNILLVVLKTPLILGNYFIDPRSLTYGFFITAAAVLFFFNHAMPFLVYMIVNSIFRKEVMKILYFRSNRQISDTQTNSNRIVPISNIPTRK